MKRFVIPFLFILSTFSKGIAQGDIEKNNFVNENAITAQAGLYLLFAGSAGLGYERVLFPLEEDYFGGLRAKVDLGSFTSGFYKSLRIGILSGRKNSHLELFAGAQHINYRIESHDPAGEVRKYNKIEFSGNLGYRYQKPDGWFIFRTGIGYPELAYIGFGVAF